MSDLTAVPKELNGSERSLIVSHLKALLKSGARETRCFDFHLPGKPPLFIKQGGDVLAEADTQYFFYVLAQGDTSAPLIPKVFDAFCQERYCFFVMEKIESTTLETGNILESEAIERAASAVKWLLDQMPLVPGSVFGRISSEEGACVWHRFFKDHQAPVPFVNAKGLLKYVLQAFNYCPRGARLSASILDKLSTSFSEDLSIYHSDIRKDNFLISTETGRTCMIDFQHVSVLPKPFQTFAFFNIGQAFAAAVGRKLGYERSEIASKLAKASGTLKQFGGDASLNLDKWGERVSRRTKDLP